MSAKPQPMAGQSDAADDLINELAKLMQQESDKDGARQPARPVFSVRIPGEAAAPPTAAPRLDTARPAAPETPSPQRQAPAASTPSTPAPGAEPFNFDFDLNLPSRGAVSAAPIRPAAVSPAPSQAPSQTEQSHDSIADLIAAELSAEAAAPQTPKPVTPAPAAPVERQYAPGFGAAPSARTSAPEARMPAPNLDGPSSPRPEKPEQDRFSVPPVFGLGSRATPVQTDISPVVTTPSAPAPTPAAVEPRFVQPQVAQGPQPQTTPVPAPRSDVTKASVPVSADDDAIGRDPIDEIENLIGRAMRVEFDTPPEPVVERAAPSPALRSLATPIAPAVPAATLPRSVSTADEAIMAAAHATGVEIGYVDDEVAADPQPVITRRRSPRALGMTRALAGPLVAVTLLLAAGFGLYWVLGLGQNNGPAPLLTADTSPTKQTPVVEPEAATQQSVVFNEIDGVVPGAEEQLVSRDQTDLNEVTQIPPTADVSEEGLANRKVRTVTVRPDGTIVSGEDSVAGSTILPVARPVVPDVPGAETASPELLASAEPITEPTPTPAATPELEPDVTVVPVTPGSTVPAVDAQGNPVAGKTAPVPLVRPAGLVGQSASIAPTSPVNAVVDTPVSTGNSLPPPPTNSALSTTPAATTAAQPAITQPAAAPVQSATIPGAVEVEALGNTAPAYVQLASQRTEEEARATAQAMVTRYGPLFGGANMEVQRVDLGTRGIYYRVRVPAGSMQDANTICTNVKAAGGDCLAM